MEYINAVFTITLDHFPININEEIIPAHPNIPRLVARGIDSHSPRYIALKDVGEAFSTNTDLHDLVQCMDQLKWALNFLHDNNVAHGNVSLENLRFKKGSSVGIQVIGLENAILSPNDDQKKKDFIDRDDLCRKIGIPLELPEDVLHYIAIVLNGITIIYDYKTMEEIEIELDSINLYISKGTFSAIPIEALTPGQIKELAMLSTHALFGTVYLNESVRCPIDDALLLDYYHESQNMAEVIHGGDPYPMSTAMQWIGQLAHGIQFLGDLNYVHGAICPNNIQIVGSCVKIFGLENVFKSHRDTRLSYLDPAYIASNRKSISPSSDEYSLRVVIREILDRQAPNKDLDSKSISHRIVSLIAWAEKRTFENEPSINLEFKLDDLNFIASCCDGSVLFKDASLYHLSMVARNFYIFPACAKDVVLDRKREVDEFLDEYQTWPLIEIKTEKKKKVLCFQRTIGSHIQLETTSYSIRNPNRISVEECKCTKKCLPGHVFMNRTLDFGEQIKLTANPKSQGAIYRLSFTKQPDGTELDEQLSRDAQHRGTVKLDRKPFRTSKNRLNPELDLIMADESDLNDLQNDFKLMDLFDPMIGWIWPLDLKSVEYKGTKFRLFPPEDRSVSDDISNQINPISLLTATHELGVFAGHPLFVNIRGLVRNDSGVTGALIDDVEGSLWNKVIMDKSWRFNRREIYLWVKQVIDALILKEKVDSYYWFNSKSVFITKDRNAKLFLVRIDDYEDEGMDESHNHTPSRRKFSRESSNDSIKEYGLVYALGTFVWEILHRKKYSGRKHDIDDNVGDSLLRKLIKMCWSTDPPSFTTLSKSVSAELTKIDLGFHEESLEWKFAPSMGSGTYSTVKVVNVHSIGSAVYKQFKAALTNDGKMEALLYRQREVETLRLTRLNKFFVACVGVVGNYYDIKGVLFEKMLGDMYIEIIHNINLKYGAYEISSWSCQIGSALLFLHDHSIVHRDIKPMNILVDKLFKQVKLADFGVMTTFKKTTNFHGTHVYMAPEAKSNERGHVTAMMDIFSFGATLYELIQRADFDYSETEEVTVDADKDFANIGFFVQRCCRYNPHERPKTHEVVLYLKRKVDQYTGNP